MPTQVELPDGNIAEFPDEMSQEQIEAVIRQQYAPPPQNSVPRAIGVPVRGFNEGAASAADLIVSTPYNILKNIVGLAGVLTNEISQLTTGENSEMALSATGWAGSQSPRPFTALAEKAGQLPEDYKPQTTAERFAARGGEFLGGAAVTGGLTPASASRSLAPQIGRVAEAPVVERVADIGRQVAATTGAAIGSQTAEEVAPGSLPAQIVGTIAGGLAPSAVENIAQRLTGTTAAKQKIAEQLKTAQNFKEAGIKTNAAPDDVVASYILKDGKAVADKVAEQVEKQGFSKGVIAEIKSTTPETRAKMREMINITRRGRSNERYALENRPGDVAGAAMTDRVKYVLNVNKKAAGELDGVAKSLKGQQVDYSDPMSNFISSLDDIGVQLDNKLRPRFKGSDVEGAAGAEKVINQIVTRLRDTKTPDAYDLHRLKRFIDEQVAYGKSAEGLTGRAEGIVKKLRADIDGVLDKQFPEYNRVNTTYADTIGALDDLQSIAGKKIDLTGENADKAVGVLLRRLTSNTQSRVPLLDATKSLDAVASKYGAQFKDDPYSLLMFANSIDEVIGPTATTSIRGEMSKSAREAAEVATGRRSIGGAALAKGGELLEKARGINEENALKAIEELLKR